MKLIWRLPGPDNFNNNVIDSLNEGKNVVVLYQGKLPSDFFMRIKESLHRETDFSFQVLKIPHDTNCKYPVECLFNIFCHASRGEARRTIKSLYQSDRFIGRVLGIDGALLSDRTKWKEFFEEYELQCREYNLLTRTLFLILLPADSSFPRPKEEACMTWKKWDDAISEVDMYLFNCFLYKNKSLTMLQRKLAITICTALSLWDFELAKYLSRHDFASLLEPHRSMKWFGQQQGWQELLHADREDLLKNAVLQYFEGNYHYHSAFLSLNGEDVTLKRRIWNAEVMVLFPFIERQRQLLIEQIKNMLVLPFNSDYGEIDDPRDLEIGHIHYQIFNFR
ncbi:hypothetical protein ACFL35_16190, partial [Candidatus Riflebacteria bacterium]